ncbi:MAG: hypothetical protein KJ065_07845 [Anaerolineae bacterium]|nr:hypothetical protein [Anaerolineae bacterium]
MRRFWLIMVLGLLMLMFGVTLMAGAQDEAAVSAYLFNSANPQLVRVNADGTQVTYDLGLPAGVFLSPFDMAFTRDGSRVAYCMQLPPNDANGGQPLSQVVIRDLQTAVDLHVIDLGPVMGCRLSMFSADDTQLAAGVINYFPGAPDVPADAPVWQVFAIDAASGQMINGIGSNSSPLFQTEPITRGGFLPDARYFDNNQIVFSLLPYGTEGLPEYPSYVWNLADGSISEIEHWGKSSVDSLPTGELIWVDYDSSLPAGQPGGPMPTFNIVRLADKTGQARTIFSSPDWIPFRAMFVNDGREILIQLLQPFDPSNEMMQQGTRFVALERSGNVRELDAYISFAEPAPAPGGYFLLWSEDTGGTAPPPIHFDYHSADERREIWSITSDNIGVSWSIVWTPPATATVGDALQPFPAVR